MLKFEFFPFERALAFQITGQTPEYLKDIKENGNFEASNGWTITSDACPEISAQRKTIFLRGSDNTKDLRVHRIWDLSSNDVRDRIIYEASKALNEFKYAVAAKARVSPFADRPIFNAAVVEVFISKAAAEAYDGGELPGVETSKTSITGKNTVNTPVAGS